MEELRNPSVNVDMVKLFVGQIPKDMDEESLRVYFEEFGPLSELSIIRDSANLTSKGCAFVTYRHAESAQFAVEKLHDKVKLPNSLNALQVRIAETQTERENKLFIGMLPKTMNEQDLHSMFITYGELREVHIIRGPDGSPKGCAFVKFVDRDAAFAAIEDLNDSIPVGGTRPLVVKFADSKKTGKKNEMNYDEDLVGFQGRKPNDFWYPGQPPQMQQGRGPPQQQQKFMYSAYPPQQPNRFMYMPGGAASQGYYPPQSPQGGGYNITGPDGYGDKKKGPSDYYLDRDSSGVYGAAGGVNGGSNKPTNVYPPPASVNTNVNNTAGSRFDHDASDPSVGAPLPNSGSGDGDTHSRPPEGPSGANLFIYHLPRDLTDADLATLFAPFGNVISAKVFVDKKTSDSKGFGFVSYDVLESANSAIESMNGFQIGSKRLKVQHKKIMGSNDDESNYPYNSGGGGVDHSRQAYPPVRRDNNIGGGNVGAGGMNSLIGGMGSMNMYGAPPPMNTDMNGYAGRGGGAMNQNYSFMEYNRGPQGPPQGYGHPNVGPVTGMPPPNLGNDFLNQQRRYQQY